MLKFLDKNQTKLKTLSVAKKTLYSLIIQWNFVKLCNCRIVAFFKQELEEILAKCSLLRNCFCD